MSVDFNGVGGVGVKLTEEMVDSAISAGLFTRDEWDDSASECMEEFDILFATAGNAYSGSLSFYLCVEGNTLREINKNAPGLVDKLKRFGVDIPVDDLEIIEDLYIW